MFFAHIAYQELSFPDDSDNRLSDAQEAEARADGDLRLLPALIEDEPDDLPPGPGAEQRETR
jgi:hypothetical protein